MKDYKRYAVLDKTGNVLNIIVIDDPKDYKVPKNQKIQLLADTIDKDDANKNQFKDMKTKLQNHEIGKPLKNK